MDMESSIAAAHGARHRTKGLSPLIAVVILIGLTLFIGGLVGNMVTQIINQNKELSATAQRCIDAKVIIQNGIYDKQSKNLTLIVYNYGSTHVALSPLLKYTNLTRHPTQVVPLKDIVIDSPAGDIKSVAIANVDDDLEQVSIQSVECPQPGCYRCQNAQDLLLDTNINGL